MEQLPPRFARLLAIPAYALVIAAAGAMLGLWPFFPWVWLPLVAALALVIGYALFSWLLER